MPFCISTLVTRLCLVTPGAGLCSELRTACAGRFTSESRQCREAEPPERYSQAEPGNEVASCPGGAAAGFKKGVSP